MPGLAGTKTRDLSNEYERSEVMKIPVDNTFPLNTSDNDIVRCQEIGTIVCMYRVAVGRKVLRATLVSHQLVPREGAGDNCSPVKSSHTWTTSLFLLPFRTYTIKRDSNPVSGTRAALFPLLFPSSPFSLFSLLGSFVYSSLPFASSSNLLPLNFLQSSSYSPFRFPSPDSFSDLLHCSISAA